MNVDLNPSSSNIKVKHWRLCGGKSGKLNQFQLSRCPDDFLLLCSHRKSGITRRLSWTLQTVRSRLCEQAAQPVKKGVLSEQEALFSETTLLPDLSIFCLVPFLGAKGKQ